MRGRVALRDYGGSGRPVVFVPSLINPPAILDLDSGPTGASLLRWMATRRCRVLLVDWGEPTAADRVSDIADHVAAMLVPLIQSLDEPPILVGYCLGGTIALAAAAISHVAGLATIAAPWRFAGYGDARPAMLDLWRHAEPACAALGLVPMELLQSGFWRLDPARTVAKFAAFGRMPPDSDAARAFVRLEDGANAGAPLPYASGATCSTGSLPTTIRARAAGRSTASRSIRPHSPAPRSNSSPRPTASFPPRPPRGCPNAATSQSAMSA